jgi:hypothetical protein
VNVASKVPQGIGLVEAASAGDLGYLPPSTGHERHALERSTITIHLDEFPSLLER